MPEAVHAPNLAPAGVFTPKICAFGNENLVPDGQQIKLGFSKLTVATSGRHQVEPGYFLCREHTRHHTAFFFLLFGDEATPTGKHFWFSV